MAAKKLYHSNINISVIYIMKVFTLSFIEKQAIFFILMLIGKCAHSGEIVLAS